MAENKCTIVYLETFKRDLRYAVKYLKNTGGNKQKFRENLKDFMGRLEEQPEMWRVPKDRMAIKYDYRLGIMDKYVILYTYSKDENICEITHIRKGKQNYEFLLTD